MKLTKIAVAAAFALMSGRVYAFHSGGVAECEGCHTMHNSSAESVEAYAPQMTLNNLAVGQTNPFLLQGQDQSSTCLRCHSNKPPGSYHILSADQAGLGNAMDPNQLNYTPGGDFAWTLNQWNYTGYEGPADQAGPRAGHNVLAGDFGMALDARQAPPGSGTNGATIGWNGARFACTSCHDPHGRYRYTSSTAGTFVTQGPAITGSGSYGDSRGTRIASYAAKITSTITVGAYRILGGVGYVPKSGNGPAAGFVNGPPIALAPSSYNVSESPTGALGQWAGQVQVSYGAGMSEWCSNCHPAMHSDTVEGATVTGLTRHPAGGGAKLGSLAANYNTYISSGNTAGTYTSNYDSLVPFEQGTMDLDVLKAGTTLTGYNGGYVAVAASGTNSNAMCLSCHRAHASAFNFSTRWFNDGEFVTSTSGWATAKGTNVTTAQNQTITKAGYYQRPSTMYGSYQRSLCNKCHAKD
jgi:hypothetical protein